MGPINNDQPFPTFFCCYGGDSPPNGLPFALLILILEGMGCWDDFDQPPQNGFMQAAGAAGLGAAGTAGTAGKAGQPEAERVGNWLQDIQVLSVSIFFR